MRHSFIVFMIFCATIAHTQDMPSPFADRFDLGIGVGLDYGGIGARGTCLVTSHLALFASAGYNFNALGSNMGAQWLIPVNKDYVYFTGMYGYNSVLIVEGAINEKGTYYGFTGGIGYQLMTRFGNRYWNFEFLLPVRNSNFTKDLNALNALGANVSNPYPVAISIGFHFR